MDSETDNMNVVNNWMRFYAVCILVTVFTIGCQPKESTSITGIHKDTETSGKNSQATPVQPSSTSASREEIRERAKDCTARADLIASREGLGNEKNVLGVQNHYSPAFSRCFLRINYLNDEARNSPILPLNYYELWDAYEDKLLSICTDGPASGHGVFCRIEAEGFVKCDVCRSFVKDRMTK